MRGTYLKSERTNICTSWCLFFDCVYVDFMHVGIKYIFCARVIFAPHYVGIEYIVCVRGVAPCVRT